MIYRIVLILILPLALQVFAQKVQPDSVFEDSSTVSSDSLSLYWYDITNHVRFPADSSKYSIYISGDEKNLNYVGIHDLFREDAQWFYYDLKENGRPAYLAPLNLFPHQTSVFYTGILMNDPVHGMYNTQFLSVSNTHIIETGTVNGGIQSYGFGGAGRLQFTPKSLYHDEPYTRILYKQGAFGFSMLDISFAKSFSKKFAIQLGGFNNLYDGTLNTAFFRGTNFRGEMNWQYSPELYIRGQFYLDRHRVGLAQYYLQNEVVLPNVREIRDDYIVDVTWLSDESHSNRLRILLFASSYFKELRDEFNTNYYLEFENIRYGVDANYDLSAKYFDLLIGSAAMYTRVWGIPFAKTYYPHSGNLYASAAIYPVEFLRIFGSLNMVTQPDYAPQISGFAGLDLQLAAKQNVEVSLGRSVRLPNTGERFFSFDTLFGNPDLVPEMHYRLEAKYKTKVKYDMDLTLSGGLHRVENEILWNQPEYYNAGVSRSFIFTGLSFGFNIWKFHLTGGGQYTIADKNITSRSSAWGKAHFHDVWLNGALIVDVYGMAHFFDQHLNLFFDPRMDRFFSGEKNTPAANVFNWKAAATIQEARIFFEMDNALSNEFEVIRGYTEFYIRWRFGVDWILWE